MHRAGGDLFLCPTVRLLADTPAPVEDGEHAAVGGSSGGGGGGGGQGVEHQGQGLGPYDLEYDGGGHRLVLPDKEHLGGWVGGS